MHHRRHLGGSHGRCNRRASTERQIRIAGWNARVREMIHVERGGCVRRIFAFRRRMMIHVVVRGGCVKHMFTSRKAMIHGCVKRMFAFRKAMIHVTRGGGEQVRESIDLVLSETVRLESIRGA